MTQKLLYLEDDGLLTPEVGSWAEDKYRLIGVYAKMFSTGTKSTWDLRVYIDLFAGAGRAKLENSSRIVSASPLLAMKIPDQFSKYIFCEQDGEKLKALEARVSKEFPDAKVSYICGDANENVEKILEDIPRYSTDHKVLSFCFVDPYNLKNLKFATIKRLAKCYIDFLILIPSFMDAHRNLTYYIDGNNSVIEDFTGFSKWREEWHKVQLTGGEFGVFVSDLFAHEMEKLRYIQSDSSDMKLVKSTDKNLRLYHLAFFSRSKLGVKFWQQAKKYSIDQTDLFA